MANHKESLPTMNNQARPNSIPPETVIKLVNNQEKELELRAQDLNFRKQQDDHSYDFGLKALDGKIKDRELQRAHEQKVQKNLYILVGILAFFIMFFGSYALYLNKDQIVLELVKIISSFAVGIFGGYHWGKSNNSLENNEGTNPAK